MCDVGTTGICLRLDRPPAAGASQFRKLLGFATSTAFEVAPLDLNAIARESVTRIKRLLPEGVRVRTVLSPNLPTFEGNRQQIALILLNLCVNAGEAIERHGMVTVETYVREVTAANEEENPDVKKGRYTVLRISDTGRGIPLDLQKRIFQPFFTTTKDHRGMGLTAVEGIVRAHFGHIEVQSVPGAGTRFEMLFPVKWLAKDRALQYEREAFKQPREAAQTILLVEDEASVRQATKQMIESMGYECLEAQNGLEAARCYARLEDKIAVVVLDMMMPIMSGRETYECIRAVNPQAKVIFSSGYDINNVAKHLEISSDAYYIQKPYGFEALKETIQEALGARLGAN